MGSPGAASIPMAPSIAFPAELGAAAFCTCVSTKESESLPATQPVSVTGVPFAAEVVSSAAVAAAARPRPRARPVPSKEFFMCASIAGASASARAASDTAPSAFQARHAPGLAHPTQGERASRVTLSGCWILRDDTRPSASHEKGWLAPPHDSRSAGGLSLAGVGHVLGRDRLTPHAMLGRVRHVLVEVLAFPASRDVVLGLLRIALHR